MHHKIGRVLEPVRVVLDEFVLVRVQQIDQAHDAIPSVLLNVFAVAHVPTVGVIAM